MADTVAKQGNSNNGTTTPATPGSLTTTAGNLLIVHIIAKGTSPTIATPTSAGTWTQIQKTQGAVISYAMYMQANTAGGAINPSSVLGGTVTGWIANIIEFTQCGANCGLQGSNMLTSAVAQLTNIFPLSPQANPNTLFVYGVGRNGGLITPQNSGLNAQNQTSGWSSSFFPQENVQGCSLDFFWGSNLCQQLYTPYPSASGLLDSAVASVAIGAWFNTIASPFQQTPGNIGGSEGIYVPQFYQGMVGG